MEKVHRHIYGTRTGETPPFAIWPTKLKSSSSKQLSPSFRGHARQRQNHSADSTSLELHDTHRARQRDRIVDTPENGVSNGPDYLHPNPLLDPHTLGPTSDIRYQESAANYSCKWPSLEDSSENGECALCMVDLFKLIAYANLRKLVVEAVLSDVLDLYLSRNNTPIIEWREVAVKLEESQPKDMLGNSQMRSKGGRNARQSSSSRFDLSPRRRSRSNGRKISDRLNTILNEPNCITPQESRFASRIPRWKGLSKPSTTGKDVELDYRLPDNCHLPQESKIELLAYELNCEDRFEGICEHVLLEPAFGEMRAAEAKAASWNILDEDRCQQLLPSTIEMSGLRSSKSHEKQASYRNVLADSVHTCRSNGGQVFELSTLKDATKIGVAGPGFHPPLTASSRSSDLRPIAFQLATVSPQRQPKTFYPHANTTLMPIPDNKVWRLRPCYLLIFLGVLTVAGSLAPALWRSTQDKDLSGGFGLAQYILGVGVFAVGSMVAIHSRRCSCWRS